MKHLLFLVLILPAHLLGQSRIGVISDPDGFTNIRFEPTINSQVIARVFEDEKFTYFKSDTTDWWLVLKAYTNHIGYVHKSKIKFVKSGLITRRFEVTDDSTKVNLRELNFDRFKLQIFNFKSVHHRANVHCIAQIRTVGEGFIIDQLHFAPISPLGGHFGITLHEETLSNYPVIGSKYGDYDSRLLLIFETGHIKNIRGGYYLYRPGKHDIVATQEESKHLTLYDIESEFLKYTEAPNWISYYDLYLNGEELYYKDDNDGGNYYAVNYFNPYFEKVNLPDSVINYLVPFEDKATSYKECSCDY